MRYCVVLLAFGFATVAPPVAAAQAARIGRLPVLVLPPAGVGTCRNDPVTAALRNDGVARLVSFRSSDSSEHRLISLGMSASGRFVMLSAAMGSEQGRRGESESVSVFFRADGSVMNGRRNAFTTGTPARLSDDRHLGLLPTDTLAVRRLAAALRERCHA